MNIERNSFAFENNYKPADCSSVPSLGITLEDLQDTPQKSMEIDQ